jgi:hypothetical protein
MLEEKCPLEKNVPMFCHIFKGVPYIWFCTWFLLNLTFFKEWNQGVTKRCRLSYLANSLFVYEPKWGGGGWVAGLNQWEQLCSWSPNKLWRFNSKFNLWVRLYHVSLENEDWWEGVSSCMRLLTDPWEWWVFIGRVRRHITQFLFIKRGRGL